MVFSGIFNKGSQNSNPKNAENRPRDMPEFDNDNDFEKEMSSPDKLLADELFEDPKTPQEHISQKAIQKPAQPQVQQKIPAFVRLDRYKEICLAMRDMKTASAEMRKTIENLRQNRDGGTALLNDTVNDLDNIEKNIDNIRGILRT